MRTTRTARLAVLAAAAATALLTGCSSGTPETAAPASPSSASVASPSAAVPVAPTPGITCDDLAKTATTLTTYVHYVALNVGTTNDSATYYPTIDQAQVDLGALAPECAPKAAAAVTTLAGSIDELQAGMTSGEDAAAIDADVALLAEVRSDGIAAYRALGVPVVGWQDRPENRVSG
jgi:hypothetical protein